MKTKPKTKTKTKTVQAQPVATKYDKLRTLITDYVDAAVAESWAGGGDPIDVPILAARMALTKALLEQHINQMEHDDND
jgi:hypothetical protein